jgi:AraC-like DNA-binding protein
VATIPALQALHVLRAAEKECLPLGPLEHACGVRRDEAVGFADRIPVERLFRVWEAAAAHGVEPGFPLRAAQVQATDTANPVRFLCSTAGDLREMVALFSRFFPVVTRAYGFAMRPAGEGVALVLDAHDLPDRLGAYCAVEFAMAGAVFCGRLFTGAPWRPRRVAFAHPRGAAEARAHAAFFGVGVAFRAARSEVVIPPEALALRTLHPDPGLHRYLLAQMEALLERSRDELGLIAQVRQHIAAALAHGPPSLRDVARRVGASERTLHRRLVAERASFKALVDEVRRSICESTLALEDDEALAERLGFSEVRAFRRAFKRWTGETPARRRAALSSTSGPSAPEAR